MAFRFKKQIFGFMDLLRFKKMTDIRRTHLQEGADTPIPETYTVNETARILHPGNQDAKLVQIIEQSEDTKTYVFALSRPMFFRAGQYVTVRTKIGDSVVSRPYAISSSPLQALEEKRLHVTIKACGFFSKWMFDNAKVGDVMTIGDPSGDFYYDSIKDANHIVAIAGGSGITPFYSLASAMAEGTESCTMTLFYGAKTKKDLVFRDQLDALVSDRFRVVYVLSNSTVKGMEKGFITADLIRRYVDVPDFTVMMCGPQAMYEFVGKELESLRLPAKRIKREANCVGTRDVEPKQYTLTVHIQDQTYTVPADNRETLLTAMERAGLTVPAKCRAGGCGFCHSKLVSGTFSIAGADKRRLADSKFGYLHPCCSYPDSDIELIVPRG